MSQRSMRWVFTAVGTAGDLIPLIALAAEMTRRGHQCHMLGNENGAVHAEKAGVPFTPIALAHSNHVVDVVRGFGRFVFPSYPPVYSHFEQAARSPERWVVVTSTVHSAAVHMCERYSLPLCRVYLAPANLRSMVCPQWPWRKELRGAAGRGYQKYVLPRMYRLMEEDSYVVSNMNQHRERVGLPRIRSTRELERVFSGHLAFFPDWFASRAPDWPEDLLLAGFPLPRSDAALPERLKAFVGRHGRPVVFTPGTGVPDVEVFFEEARKCCEQLGVPGLFLSPHAHEPSSANILHFDYLDLEVALRSAAALVHHGGIGTVARGIQAGVPQVVIPRAYDQPDNGNRLQELGVGEVLEFDDYRVEALVPVLRRMLMSEAVRQNLLPLTERARAATAVATAADYLERWQPAN